MLDEITVARRALGLVDLTRLGSLEKAADMEALCECAMTAHGPVAAVCVWPQFVRQCCKALAGTGVRVAAVANFPHGGSDVDAAVLQTQDIVADGADEVDLVMAYQAWLSGRRELNLDLIARCKAACGPGVVLKVILETGVLATPEAVREASLDAIDSGADFIKTSTGKTPVSATPEAAAIMLKAICDRGAEVGFKAAGGIRELAQAAEYLSLADEIMGREWVCRARFRFGASGLLDTLLNVIEGRAGNDTTDDY